MADLTDKEASQSVKISGASSTGAESNFAKVTSNQDLGTSDIIDTGGVEGAVSVSTTAVAVRVGVSNLANRKALTAHNNGTGTLYWGYTAGVTAATGTPLMRNQFASWDIGPTVTVYIIAASGSHDVRVTEGS